MNNQVSRFVEISAAFTAVIVTASYVLGRMRLEVYYRSFNTSPQDIGFSFEEIAFQSFPVYSIVIVTFLCLYIIDRFSRPTVIMSRDVEDYGRLGRLLKRGPALVIVVVSLDAVFALFADYSLLAEWPRTATDVHELLSAFLPYLPFAVPLLMWWHYSRKSDRRVGGILPVFSFLAISFFQFPLSSGYLDAWADKANSSAGYASSLYSYDDIFVSGDCSDGYCTSGEVRILGINNDFVIIWSESLGTRYYPSEDIAFIDR